MKRANTMSTITVELTIKVKTKFTSSNAENIQWIHLTTDVKFSQAVHPTGIGVGLLGDTSYTAKISLGF